MEDNVDLKMLKQEVDSLQILLAKEKAPWYKSAPVLIALFAFIFSFGTTLVSYYNSHRQEIRENRREARELLQRISKLPLENFELLKKYEGDALGQSLAGMVNQENLLLITQTVEMIKRFPDSFSSTEYFAVTTALAGSNITTDLPFFYEKAITKAENSNDYNVASRAFATYLFSIGKIDLSRKYYDLALNTWNKFPSNNQHFVNSTDAYNLMCWAQSESSINNHPKANELIDIAIQKAQLLPNSQFKDSLVNQINYTLKMIEQTAARDGYLHP